MRASTGPIELALGYEKTDLGLRAPKLETLVLKKIILLQIFKFIAKSLMVGPVNKFLSPDLALQGLDLAQI